MIRGHAVAAIAVLLMRCNTGAPMHDQPLPLDVMARIPEDAGTGARDLMQASGELASAFATATRLYETGRYAWAGDAFLNAARAARGFDELASNRASCYRNAARAWKMAGTFEEKGPLFEEAARADPLCAPDLREIVEMLRR